MLLTLIRPFILIVFQLNFIYLNILFGHQIMGNFNNLINNCLEVIYLNKYIISFSCNKKLPKPLSILNDNKFILINFIFNLLNII